MLASEICGVKRPLKNHFQKSRTHYREHDITARTDAWCIFLVGFWVLSFGYCFILLFVYWMFTLLNCQVLKSRQSAAVLLSSCIQKSSKWDAHREWEGAFLDRQPSPFFTQEERGVHVAMQIQKGEVQFPSHCQNKSPVWNKLLIQNWGKIRKELLLAEDIETKKSSIYTMKLSAKLRKMCLHVHWFCCFQLRTTVLRNALFCKTCPAQEGTGNTEIGSRGVLSFSLAVPTGAVGGRVVSHSSPLTT